MIYSHEPDKRRGTHLIFILFIWQQDIPLPLIHEIPFASDTECGRKLKEKLSILLPIDLFVIAYLFKADIRKRAKNREFQFHEAKDEIST